MTSEELVVEMEQKRCTAILDGRIDDLEALLADDLVVVHGSGKIDTKSSFLALARSGQYVGWRETDLKVKVYDGVAVVTGHRSVQVRRPDVERSVEARFVTVWVKHGDAWRNILSQSSNISA